jgi:alkylated DNA repair dioxygenase AlkB
MDRDQADLFDHPVPSWPEGFRYSAAVIPTALQSSVLHELTQLPFKSFDFHGFEGKRRVVSFGWRYDFAMEKLEKTRDIPAFLLPVRRLAAGFAGIDEARLQQALVTEYSPGAPIGWHRDKAVFGLVIGVSLLSTCTFRLRRKRENKWERVSIEAEPGSAYLLSGSARAEWEHSIPPVDKMRYSITFRDLQREP